MNAKSKALGQIMKDIPTGYKGTSRKISKGKNKGMYQVFDMHKQS